MAVHSISRIALEYALNKAEEPVLNWILTNELKKEEKQQILMNLCDERVNQILLNLGFDKEFLKTIKE